MILAVCKNNCACLELHFVRVLLQLSGSLIFLHDFKFPNSHYFHQKKEKKKGSKDQKMYLKNVDFVISFGIIRSLSFSIYYHYDFTQTYIITMIMGSNSRIVLR